MKLQQSSIDLCKRWGITGLAGIGLFVSGLVLGTGYIKPDFFSAKFHEWLAATGTAGALIVMAWTSFRDKAWRRADQIAQGRIVWGILAMETVRIATAFEVFELELEEWVSPGVPNALHYPAFAREHLLKVDSFVQVFFHHADRLHLLPPVIGTKLGTFLGTYPHWKTLLNETIVPHQDLGLHRNFGKMALELTINLRENLDQCLEAGRMPEDELWD